MKKILFIIVIILVILCAGMLMWYNFWLKKQPVETRYQESTGMEQALVENAQSVKENYPWAYLLPIKTDTYKIAYSDPKTLKVTYTGVKPTEEAIIQILKAKVTEKKIEYVDHQIIFEQKIASSSPQLNISD